MNILLVLAKKIVKNKKSNFSRSGLFHMKTTVCLKYYVNGWKVACLRGRRSSVMTR